MSSEDYGNNPSANNSRNQRSIETGKTKNRINKNDTRDRLRRLESIVASLQLQLSKLEGKIHTFYKIAKDKKGNTIIVTKK